MHIRNGGLRLPACLKRFRRPEGARCCKPLTACSSLPLTPTLSRPGGFERSGSLVATVWGCTVRALIQKLLGRGSDLEFLWVFVVLVVFLRFSAGFSTLPALFYSWCFCGAFLLTETSQYIST